MSALGLVASSTLAGLHAAAMSVVFTAPRPYLLPTLVCGFAARFVRDGSILVGVGPALATVMAATAAVLVAVTVTPKRAVPPVVLIASVLQLGAGVAVLDVILELLRVSTLEGPALLDASGRLTASVGRALTSFAAIAIGLQIGIVLTRRDARE